MSESCPCPPLISPLSPWSSLSFLLVTWRPPRFPLFPYTTLFRSSLACPARSRRRDRPGLGGSRPRSAAGDRKSTRLNSSHITISYAVFCLKKKKLRTCAWQYTTFLSLAIGVVQRSPPRDDRVESC